MRNYLLAAVAAAAITATPAFARDGSGYIGVEGGVIFGGETELDLVVNGTEFDDAADIEFQTGLDADMIAGYDFGMFRAEAELGYKRMKADSIDFNGPILPLLTGFGVPLVNGELDLDGKANVLSLMGNLLVDFGNDDGISFYAGGGFGRARVKALDDRDSAWAWQGIVGARAAALPQVDVGLKYRYFQTGKLEFGGDFNGAGIGGGYVTDGKFKSHSILASLIYNFAAPAVPPPPPPPPPPEPAPPPPPETVTCPDGSVIPATSECPLPPPPPPPEPAPERG